MFFPLTMRTYTTTVHVYVRFFRRFRYFDITCIITKEKSAPPLWENVVCAVQVPRRGKIETVKILPFEDCLFRKKAFDTRILATTTTTTTRTCLQYKKT